MANNLNFNDQQNVKAALLEYEKDVKINGKFKIGTKKDEYIGNVDHIYAIGDVVYGNVQLAHVASAQAIHVPVSRIQDILHNRRKITIDTSLRLAKLFGVSDEYFINMQNDIDIRMQKRKLDLELQQIKTIQYA